MSITMHTALYQKSDETSQGLADFTTSVFKTNALSVPPLRLDDGKRASSVLKLS